MTTLLPIFDGTAPPTPPQRSANPSHRILWLDDDDDTFGRHFEMSWTHVERTEEFDSQHGNDRFGPIMAKLK